MASPQDCRENAARCIEMANEAGSDTRMQSIMFEMANTWLKLAGEIERSRVPPAPMPDASAKV